MLNVPPADFYQNKARLFNHSKYQYKLKMYSLDVNIICVRIINDHGKAKKIVAI
jgi:hypothetical protein